MNSSIPAFWDLGKAVKNLFVKGFLAGESRIEWKIPAEDGSKSIGTGNYSRDLKLASTGSYNHDSGAVSGDMKLKFKLVGGDQGPEDAPSMVCGLKVHSNMLSELELGVENRPVRGLRLFYEAQIHPLIGSRQRKIKMALKTRMLRTDLAVDLMGPNISVATVFKPGTSWFVGLHHSFDRLARKLTRCNFAIGSSGKDYLFLINLIDTKTMDYSYYHRVTDSIELGIMTSQPINNYLASKYAIAASYVLNDTMTVKAKLNNQYQIGLSLQLGQKSVNGLRVTLSTLLEGQRLSEPCHKFGVGIELAS